MNEDKAEADKPGSAANGAAPSRFWSAVEPSPEVKHANLRMYRMLADTVGAGVLLYDAAKVVYANPAVERMTGFAHEDLLGMHYLQILHSESHEMLRARLTTRPSGDAPALHFDCRLNTKSGVEAWAAASAVATEYCGKSVWLVTMVDITERRRAEAAQLQVQQILAQIIDGNPVPTFVIDTDHRISHWSKSAEKLCGLSGAEVIGTSRHKNLIYGKVRLTLADLIVDAATPDIFDKYYGNKRLTCFPLVEGAYEAEAFDPAIANGGRWLHFTAAPLTNVEGKMIGAIQTAMDVTDQRRAEAAMDESQRKLEELAAIRGEQLKEATDKLKRDLTRREQAEAALLQRFNELSELHATLAGTQQQLLQSEKMASIGQLAAGVAHEINNPIGYVHSNIGSLEVYLKDLFRVLDAYGKVEAGLAADVPSYSALLKLKAELDLTFLRADIPKLILESKEGITRVRKIVQDLKDFSHVDSTHEWKWADLHRGLDSTLNVANNEIKYKADVVKEYGVIPQIECLPSELNQVFLNLLVNAAHAIGDDQRGTITVRTGIEGQWLWVEIADSGSGIPPENLKLIFDPFFTTKPVGKGTGLGLSLSYGIVEKHGGRIEIKSEVGKGSVFRVLLPLQRSVDPVAAA